MAVIFRLKDPHRETSYILCEVSFKGSRYKRSTGESVPSKIWKQNAERCSITGYPHAKAINDKLKKIYEACCSAADVFIEKMYKPTADEFWEQVDFILHGASTKKTVYFVDYFESQCHVIKENRAYNTWKKYNTVLNMLRDFETDKKKRLRFADIDISFYESFQKYIYQRGGNDNYFGSCIQCIKRVYRVARDKAKLHSFRADRDSDFKTINRTADAIYLSEEELLKIHRLKITEELYLHTFEGADKRPSNIKRSLESMEIVRKKFLIGAFTALRVSDFNRLEEVNLAGDYLKVLPQKTAVSAESVVIPIHWIIKEYLKEGFDVQTKISDAKVNKQIKKICRMAGFTQPVQVVKNIQGKNTLVTYEKWELVTTHTCRRSGATNMVKFGIPHMQVMKITGHKKWDNFIKYIKLSAQENAELVKRSGFFDKRRDETGDGKTT